MQTWAFYGEIRSSPSAAAWQPGSTSMPGLRMHKGEPIGGMRARVTAVSIKPVISVD